MDKMQKYAEKIFTHNGYSYIPKDTSGQPSGIRKKDMARAFARFKTVNCCNCFQCAEVRFVPLDQILLLLFTCMVLPKRQKTCSCQEGEQNLAFSTQAAGGKETLRSQWRTTLICLTLSPAKKKGTLQISLHVGIQGKLKSMWSCNKFL